MICLYVSFRVFKFLFNLFINNVSLIFILYFKFSNSMYKLYIEQYVFLISEIIVHYAVTNHTGLLNVVEDTKTLIVQKWLHFSLNIFGILGNTT